MAIENSRTKKLKTVNEKTRRVTITIGKSLYHGYSFEHPAVEEPMECQYVSTSSREYFPRWSLLICRRHLPGNIFTNRLTPQAVAEPE